LIRLEEDSFGRVGALRESIIFLNGQKNLSIKRKGVWELKTYGR
jgi:hypothetical protein